MYEILDDYGLLNKQKVKDQISNLEQDSINNLFVEIERYYESKLGGILSELQNPEDMNVVHYPHLDVNNFSKRLCLYADRIIINDSIYDLLSGTNKGLVIDYFKQEFYREIQGLLELKDLVDNKILFFVPFKKILRPVSKKIEEIAKQDLANPDFKEICERNLTVGLDKNETEDFSYSFIFTQLGLNLPSKFTVGLHFNTKKAGSGSIALGMSPGKPFSLTSSGKTIDLKPLRVPKSVFENDEQIQEQVEHLLMWQAEENISSLFLNSMFKAHPITNFDVMWKLMNWKFGNTDNEQNTIPALLEIDLKFLEDINVKDILKIREKEGSTFQDFRNTFNEFCKDISAIPGTSNFKKEVLDLKKEKIEPQLRKLDREFSRIKKYRSIRGVAIGIGSLSAAALGPIGVPLIAGGIATLLREYSEYDKERSKMKESPLFFLWKIKTS